MPLSSTLARTAHIAICSLVALLCVAAKVQGQPQSLEWSLDGRYAIAAGERGPAIRISSRGVPSRVPAEMTRASLSPDGRLALGVVGDIFVSVDLQTGETVEVPLDERLGKAVAWQRGPYGDVIVTRTVAHYNVRRTGGRSSDADAAPTKNFRDLWLDPVDPLAYIDTGYGVEVRHLRTGLTLRTFDAGTTEQRYLGSVRDPHGRLMFAMEDAEGFRLWAPPEPPGEVWDFLPEGSVKSLSGDGLLLAVGGEGALLMYTTKDRRQVSRTKTPSRVVDVAFAPDSTHVAAVLESGAVRVWPTATAGLSLPIERDLSEVDIGRIRTDAISRGDLPKRSPIAVWHLSGASAHVTYSPTGDLIGWVAGRLARIEPATGDEAPLALSGLSPGRPFVFSPDGAQIAAVVDKGVGIFDLKRSRLVRRLPTGGEHNQLQWRARTLVTDAVAGKVQAWDTEDGSPIGDAFVASPEPTARLSLSPDGSLIAVTGKSPRVLRVSDGTIVASLQAQWSGVIASAWSEDGRRLASAGGDGTVLIWDTSLWKPVSLIEGLSGRILTFSPDGSRLLSASWDGAVIANVSDGVLEQQLLFDGLLSSVDWSDVGVVISDSTGAIYLWPP